MLEVYYYVVVENMQRIDKLSKVEQESLIYDLVYALTAAKTIEDVSLFVQDLLTRQELKNLSKRLRIAKLLLQGKMYEEIEKDIHVSHGTVAKISAWLAQRGEGFRVIVKKLPRKETIKESGFSEWESIKKRYPMYFWPEILLEEVVKNAGARQKMRMQNILTRLDEKSDLHKRIQLLLHNKV